MGGNCGNEYTCKNIFILLYNVYINKLISSGHRYWGRCNALDVYIKTSIYAIFIYSWMYEYNGIGMKNE